MFKLEIETDNDAFADGKAGPELARILRKLAKRVESEKEITTGPSWIESGPIFDTNGNAVGTYWY